MEHLCDGCNVRGLHEHRCHGGECDCDNPICMEYQGRITHNQLMEIVNSMKPTFNPDKMKDAYSPEEIKAMLDRIAKLEEALKNTLSILCSPDGDVWLDINGYVKGKDRRIIKSAQSLLS